MQPVEAAFVPEGVALRKTAPDLKGCRGRRFPSVPSVGDVGGVSEVAKRWKWFSGMEVDTHIPRLTTPTVASSTDPHPSECVCESLFLGSNFQWVLKIKIKNDPSTTAVSAQASLRIFWNMRLAMPREARCRSMVSDGDKYGEIVQKASVVLHPDELLLGDKKLLVSLPEHLCTDEVKLRLNFVAFDVVLDDPLLLPSFLFFDLHQQLFELRVDALNRGRPITASGASHVSQKAIDVHTDSV
jgi:hypothetical protein